MFWKIFITIIILGIGAVSIIPSSSQEQLALNDENFVSPDQNKMVTHNNAITQKRKIVMIHYK